MTELSEVERSVAESLQAARTAPEASWSGTTGLLRNVHRSHRRRRIARTAATLSLVCALGGGSWLLVANLGDGPSTHAASTKTDVPTAPPPTDPSEWAAEQRLTPVYQRLTTIGANDDAFEDVAINTSRMLLQVYRTSATSTVSEQDYRNAVPAGIGIQFLPALLSAKQESQLTALVKGRDQWLANNGVDVSAFGGDGRGGPYFIGYREQTAPPNSLLQPFEIFGTHTVVFVQIAGGFS